MNTIKFMIVPPDSLMNWFWATIDATKDSFPFNIINNVSESVELAENSTTTQAGISFDFSDITGKESTFTIVNSSTLETAVGGSTKNMVFDIMEYTIWIGTAYVIISMII